MCSWGSILTIVTVVGRPSHCGQHQSLTGILYCVHGEGSWAAAWIHPPLLLMTSVLWPTASSPSCLDFLDVMQAKNKHKKEKKNLTFPSVSSIRVFYHRIRKRRQDSSILNTMREYRIHCSWQILSNFSNNLAFSIKMALVLKVVTCSQHKPNFQSLVLDKACSNFSLKILPTCQSGEIAPQGGKKNDLSYKHEDLNLIHRTHVKIPSVIGHSCIPSTGAAEAGGSLHALATQSNLIGDFWTDEKFCFER